MTYLQLVSNERCHALCHAYLLEVYICQLHELILTDLGYHKHFAILRQTISFEKFNHQLVLGGGRVGTRLFMEKDRAGQPVAISTEARVQYCAAWHPKEG